MKDLTEFTKKKPFLICVDSDGCAMDTMDVKHIKCFGPCMVQEWNLEQWETPILKRWNEINLYSMTRGINRFLGLAKALSEINDAYCEIDGLDEFVEWTKSAPELSNGALAERLSETKSACMAKALEWSKRVNQEIDALPETDKKAFAGVAEGLRAAQQTADVAVVSSANREAVVEEWQRCGLLGTVDVLCCQDTGSKAHCIAELLKQGYAQDHVLMVGDAPGDHKAAEKNGVLFYPILVRREAESWQNLPQALKALTTGEYAKLGETLYQDFLQNLGGDN